MPQPECFICKDTEGPLYRVNPKGEAGMFACIDHHPEPDTISESVRELVTIIRKM